MSSRETFATRFGTVMSMIGVAVGLGNLWRFPYMVGEFGGTAFVAYYLLAVIGIGVPALMAEWSLGRYTRRGPVGAFERAGVPGGRVLGWVFFLGVTAATGYYAGVVGWTLYHAGGELAGLLGLGVDSSLVLPPESGFRPDSYLLAAGCTLLVVVAAAQVLVRGVREGIESASSVIAPALFGILLLLIVRSVTLDGAGEGIQWYLLKFDPGSLTGSVMIAALGQAIFSLALGGTFMVIYGSYLEEGEELAGNALFTAAGDALAGLLAGLAIFPAVFALGLSPASGPELLFSTLPEVFARIPAGGLLGLLFFAALAAAAFLSVVAALEVLVAGLTDNTGLSRSRAVGVVSGLVFLFSLPPMVNMEIFVPWDLTFGSGLQMGGALLAVLSVGWALDRGDVLEQLAFSEDSRISPFLYRWIRYVIPAAVTMVTGWWILSDVLGLVSL